MRNSEGYVSTWYDVEDTDNQAQTFTVTVPALSGDLYFSAETYVQGTVPRSCQWGLYAAPMIVFTVAKNDVVISTQNYSEDWYMPV